MLLSVHMRFCMSAFRLVCAVLKDIWRFGLVVRYLVWLGFFGVAPSSYVTGIEKTLSMCLKKVRMMLYWQLRTQVQTRNLPRSSSLSRFGSRNVLRHYACLIDQETLREEAAHHRADPSCQLAWVYCPSHLRRKVGFEIEVSAGKGWNAW